jgi:putative endopeptidase
VTVRPRAFLPFVLVAAIATFLVGMGVRRTSRLALAASQPDFLRANVDASTNPGNDFFQYANGAWLKAHPIPSSESRWGIGNVVQEEIYTSLRKINDGAASARAAAGTDQQKIGDFWVTAMDEVKADRAGLTPLQAELDSIAAIATVQDVLDVAFALHQLDVNVLFSARVSQNEKNSDEMSVHVKQGGLGLPDRDYYFNQEAGVVQARTQYVGHMARMLALMGRADGADQAAKEVMAFETALATSSRKIEELRDPEKNYNKMSPADLTSRYTPSITWSDRLATWRLRPATLIVGQPEFFSALETAVGTTAIPVLKDYLRLHLVSVYASHLTKAIDDEAFRFSGGVLQGQKEQRPRWKRALDAEDEAMGMVVGRLFVKEYFPEQAKKRYSDLVEAIRGSYRDRIDKLDWMSPATKAKAQEKLAAVKKKIGYPDKWKDYSALEIGRDSYCRNMMSAARWRFDDNVSKFGKPVDRTEWEMTPQTWNAYHASSNNEIVLPAAIFTVPGVKDADLDEAVVYGYAGASTIGHEITHGFDDKGRQYDMKGNLADWWTAEDASKFKAHAEAMVRQFDAYEPLPGLRVRGRATLGENIADLGGLLVALDAFKQTEQYKKGVKIGGLTPIQRYFLSYAFGWMVQQRDERLRKSLLSDVHSPPKWRVLGPLSNIPEFHEAFGVKPGQAMYRPPESEVRIW